MADMGTIHKEIIIPNRIYLQGIQPDTTEQELENMFRKYGSIIETRIIRDRITGEKKDYAFITFDSQQVAENVKATCKSVDLHGQEIIVGTAKIQRRPKFFNRYNNNLNPGPPPPPPPPQPRFVSVPCTVSPDGLYTFHQQLLPICFPVEPSVPLEEEEEYQGLSTIPEEYPISPEPTTVTSKPGIILSAIESSKRFEPIESPNSVKKGPVTVTAADYASSNYGSTEFQRKLQSMNLGHVSPPNHLPLTSNHHDNGLGGNSIDVKNNLTTTNIHLPNINGNHPTSYGNLPTSYGNPPTSYGNIPTSYGNHPSSYGNLPSSYVSHPISYGNLPTSYGNLPTSYGNPPTSYGNIPTSYGNHPSSYGNLPSSYVSHPISYGNLPTSYGSHPTSYGNHPLNCNVDVTILNGNMAYHYFPVAAIVPSPPEWPAAVDPSYVKPDASKPNYSVPSSMPTRSVPSRVSYAGNKMNGGDPCSANVKNQPYLFMSTTHTKMNRVMAVQ